MNVVQQRMVKRKKILILVPTMNVGGVETDILRNMPKLSRVQFEVIVFPFVCLGVLAPSLVSEGVRVVGYSSQKASSANEGVSRAVWKQILERCIGKYSYQVLVKVFCSARHVIQVARVIRSEKIDVLHAFLPNAYFIGVVAALLSGCRYRVMSRVSLNFYMEKHRFLGWLERNFLHGLVTKAIGNSRVILQELADEGISPSKLFLLYNGISVNGFVEARQLRMKMRDDFHIEPNKLLITTVGNLHSYKGHQDFLESLVLVKAAIPAGWVVWIVGRDEMGNRALYETWRDENGLAGYVYFLGERSDVINILSASDIHVHPSHHEGLPNSVIEAMAAGLPVVATAIGGIPELIEDGVSGRLVPAKNPNSLAGVIIELLRDRVQRERLGNNALQRVSMSFSIEASVRAYERFYQELFK